MQRIDEYILPETAAREIIYNFLQHKAYNVAIPIQIKVYDDYIYIWNPGEIPSEVKDILFENHPSMPRNLRISETFFRAGFVEYWGSGIRRISDTCKSYGSPIPEIVNEAGGVVVKCKPSESYLKALKDVDKNSIVQTKDENIQKENLGSKKSSKKGSKKSSKLVVGEKEILDYCQTEKSLKEIAKHFGYKDIYKFKNNYINNLLATNKLKMTIPEQPRNRNQKYISIK